MNIKKPNDFLEAVKLLDNMLTQKEKDQILDYDESEVGPSLYFSLGLQIKNDWILDTTSPLGQCILKNKSIDIDKYVYLIIKLYHRYLSGKPLKIETELQKIEQEKN